MSLYQQFVRHVLYPVDGWRSGDAAELRYLREFELTQFLPLDDLRAAAFERLRRLVEHAYMDCPFYRRQFEAAGVLPSDLKRTEDLEAFPILQKRDIQQHRDEMVARSWPKSDLQLNMTGGSTGTPISFFVSRDRFRSRAAATWRHNRWAGWDIGDKTATLWGAARDAPPPGWKLRLRNLLIDRTIHLNTARITEAGLWSFHAALKRFRPKVILAYAKSIVLFARYLEWNALRAYRPQSIVTSAEVLEPEERVLIERVFGCPVFNRYGCREVSVIASECGQHRGMHLMAEGLYVEVVRNGKPVAHGELGEVLVTDLLNHAMPLIRYRIGDMAICDDSPCACGRGLPRLREVAGRVTDFLVGSEGQLVSGAALTVTVVARRPTVGQVQVVQDRQGHVLFRIAPLVGPPELESDQEFLAEEARQYLGRDTKVDFEIVEAIPKEPSGKYLFAKSAVSPDFIAVN